MKKIFFALMLLAITLSVQAQSKVYFIKEISPEALLKIYHALGVKAHGRVAVKISTGEAGGHRWLFALSEHPSLQRQPYDSRIGLPAFWRTRLEPQNE